MSKRAESVGLFIGSDGPNSGGNYEKTGSHNLYMKAGNPTDPVQYSVEGIKHFNNWKAGLSSLESTNKERFEFNHATEYVDYSFHAKKVKIIDDLAAISYPEYTDITKVVWQHEDGGLYPPVACGWYSGYDVVSVNCEKMRDGGFLPLVDRKNLDDANRQGYFDNLFFLVEYDGYYSDADGNIAYNAALDGIKEVFSYSSGETEDFGKYYFLDGLDHNYPILNSRIGAIVAGYVDFDVLVDPRVDTTQVDTDENALNLITGDLEDVYRDTHSGSGILTIEFGFLGYRTASMIKYAPAEKCGRVDIYHRKSGTISSVTSKAVATSNYHDLQSGDILKLTGALDSDSKDEFFNGIKYIQVNDSNTFTLFDDSTFLTRTDTSTLTTRSAVKWVLLGNIYDESRQGWSYKETLLSPTGRNGYEHSGSYGSEANSPLSLEYHGVETYYEIMELDLEYDSTNGTALDPYTSNITPRNRYSKLDALWAGPQHYIRDCRFGSDIDFKKINGEYRLLVGEMGPDKFIDFESPVSSFPEVGPYGKVHLFTLSLNVNKTVSVTVDETFNASTGTSGAIVTPPEVDGICDGEYFFYVESITATRIDTVTSQTYNSLTQEYYCDEFYTDYDYQTDNYWFGAMLYHIPDKFAIEANLAGEFDEADNGYFTDYNLCYLQGLYCEGVTVYQIYPYVDNFGKSVALDYAGGKVIAVVGSTTKTDLTVTPESTSCGPVHVFDVTTTVTSLQRINSSGDVATPSGFYEVQANRARKFASCIVAVDGYLAFGKSKPYEVQYLGDFIGDYDDFTNEVSSILIYQFSGSSYTYTASVTNQNDNTLTFQTTDDVSANYKELKLRDQDYTQTNYFIKKIWLTDRFGDHFDFNGQTVVTNAFDNYNDAGFEHTDAAIPDSVCDYLHVYENFGGNWKFVAKIAPSINSEDTKYDYESFVYPNNYLSLRHLANRNYANGTTNSVTWDIDLTSCYALADDRIVLKDPLGYAIFSRNWRYANTQNIESEELITSDMYPYFKYSEDFKTYESGGNLVHTKFSKMYKYNTTSTLKCYASYTNQRAEYKTPVYFLSLPDSLTVNSVSIYVKFDEVPTGVSMILYKDDPRRKLLVNWDYQWMINGYETFSEIPGDLLIVDSPSTGNPIFELGAVDASIYHDTTLEIEPPYAKLIAATSISADNVVRFDIPLIDLATYRIDGSKLANTTRVYETGVAAAHKELVMNDATQPTYDSSIEIQDTLAVGFIYGSLINSMYYTIPYEAMEIDFESDITDFDAVFNDTTVEGLSSNGKADYRLYDCVIDKVANYSNSKRQYHTTGKTRYTNPVLGLGIGSVSAHNDQLAEDMILEGTDTKSYQIFSIDNLDTMASWEIANGTPDSWSNYNYYEENRSLDISKLDSLSLFISNNVTPTGNLNLYMSNAGMATGVMPLYIGNSGTANNINLYLENVSSSGVTTLYMSPHTPSTGVTTLVLRNEVTGVNKQATLYLENTTTTGLMPLVMKTLDPTGITSSHDLYIYGNTQSVTYKESEATLLINGMVAGEHTQGMSLMILAVDSGSNNNAMPLFISNVRDSGSSSETLGMYMYNSDTVDLYGRVVRNQAPLFINSTYGATGAMPLYLSRRGTNGEEEAGKERTLFIHNSQATGNVSLVVNAVYGQTGNMNLVIPNTYGVPTGIIPTFIRGYQDE
jgi:hypothetical protein